MKHHQRGRETHDHVGPDQAGAELQAFPVFV